MCFFGSSFSRLLNDPFLDISLVVFLVGLLFLHVYILDTNTITYIHDHLRTPARPYPFSFRRTSVPRRLPALDFHILMISQGSPQRFPSRCFKLTYRSALPVPFAFFFRASLTKEFDRCAGVDLFLLAAARLAAPQNALIHVPSSTAANCSLSPI